MADGHAAVAALCAARRVRRDDPGRDDDRLAKLELDSTDPAGPSRSRCWRPTAKASTRRSSSIELTLVLLAAPAATAGAICLDKARGTLDHMLATDLSNAEIVLGKLGVRLVPVLGLIACVLPITALTSLLGGIDPTALVGSFLAAIACATLGCSLAMTLSVWGRKTHEVLMITYLILILWLIIPVVLALAADSFGAVASCQFRRRPSGIGSHVSNPYLPRLRTLHRSGQGRT